MFSPGGPLEGGGTRESCDSLAPSSKKSNILHIPESGVKNKVILMYALRISRRLTFCSSSCSWSCYCPSSYSCSCYCACFSARSCSCSSTCSTSCSTSNFYDCVCLFFCSLEAAIWTLGGAKLDPQRGAKTAFGRLGQAGPKWSPRPLRSRRPITPKEGWDGLSWSSGFSSALGFSSGVFSSRVLVLSSSDLASRVFSLKSELHSKRRCALPGFQQSSRWQVFGHRARWEL